MAQATREGPLASGTGWYGWAAARWASWPSPGLSWPPRAAGTVIAAGLVVLTAAAGVAQARRM